MGPTREEVEELLGDFRVGPDRHNAEWDDVRPSPLGGALHYDPWGEPCSLRTWCRLFEAAFRVEGAWGLYYCVGDDLVDGHRVVTIWVAGHPEPGALYETCAFRTFETVHYATRADAEAGHQAAVERARKHTPKG